MENEITYALKQMNKLKAASDDGFVLEIFKKRRKAVFV